MKLPHRLLLVGPLALHAILAAAADPAAYRPFFKDYKDWTLACDNGKRCYADHYGDGATVPTLLVRLWRDAGPDGRTTLQIDSRTPIAFDELRLDDRPFNSTSTAWTSSAAISDDDGHYSYRLRTRDSATIAAWVSAARNAQTMSFGEPANDYVPEVSLAGLSAALLAMDDAQGRLGTVTALLRRGGAPAGAVPNAPSLPRIPAPAKPVPALSKAEQRKLIRAASSRFADDVRACAHNHGDEDIRAARARANSAVALTANEALVALACQVDSAYNHTQLWYRVERKAPYVGRSMDFSKIAASRELDTISRPEGFTGRSNELLESDYIPLRSELWSLFRVRGLGDCGILTRWIFDGARFHLTEIRGQGVCNGLWSEWWPTLYRSQPQ
ncbi:DUF1176 domain-containing protein [Cupriavidus sp. 2TAF22]|uniref:DUF1176 domain-containing protein n=1 Tax=unclassified Cupriavidus TaxID=2640874 RepID=UPI003F8F38C2